MCIRQAGFGHMCFIGQDDVLLDAWSLGGDGLDKRYKGQVDKQYFVFRVVDDINQLLGKQSRVERVANCTETHDSVPGFNMTIRIPGHGGDTVTQPIPSFCKALATRNARDLRS